MLQLKVKYFNGTNMFKSGHMELTTSELSTLLEAAAIRGATIALQRTGAAVKDEIPQNEDYRSYGRARVESWLNQGLVKKIRGRTPTSKHLYSRSQLESISILTKTNRT